MTAREEDQVAAVKEPASVMSVVAVEQPGAVDPWRFFHLAAETLAARDRCLLSDLATRLGLTPAEVDAWQRAGIDSPEDMWNWRQAGYTPEYVSAIPASRRPSSVWDWPEAFERSDS